MTAYIGYDNKIIGATVTVTSEADGYPKENAYDWITSDFWKADAAGIVAYTIDFGSIIDIDCWGIAAHNLSDNSGSIKPQYSATGAWAGEEVDFDTIQTPSNNNPIFRKVTSVSTRYMRFEINSTGAASLIGSLFLGEALQLPLETGIVNTRPRHSFKDKIYNAVSDSGSFLGRSIERYGFEFKISQKFVSHAWIDLYWDDLVEHIKTKPFYYNHDYENYPAESVFCWLTNGKAPIPMEVTQKYKSFSFKVNGI